MNIAELKQQIVEKKFDNLYIFTGDEIKVMNIYINQITKLQNRTLNRKDSVAEIFKTLRIPTLTKTENVYVIMNDFDFTKQEKHWEQFMSGVKDHTIILIYSQIDKRGKFYKTYKDKFCEFEKLHESVLAKYIQKELKITTDDATKLALMCENSYNRILMETDKIKHLAQSYELDEQSAFNLAMVEDFVYTENSDLTFKIADSICKRQPKLALNLLRDLDTTQESPIAILSLVYANIKAMLLIAVCPPGSKVTETTGLTGFQVKLAHEKGNNYNPKELLNIMGIIKYIDEAIKIGKMEAHYALPYLVANIM